MAGFLFWHTLKSPMTNTNGEARGADVYGMAALDTMRAWAIGRDREQVAGEDDYTAGRRHTDGEARGADVHGMAALDIMRAWANGWDREQVVGEDDHTAGRRIVFLKSKNYVQPWIDVCSASNDCDDVLIVERDIHKLDEGLTDLVVADGVCSSHNHQHLFLVSQRWSDLRSRPVDPLSFFFPRTFKPAALGFIQGMACWFRELKMSSVWRCWFR